MEREKMLEEYKVTLDALLEKTKFMYSEEFYSLNEFDKKKYSSDKMATEGHLSTLCNVLWGKTPQMGGFGDFFALGLLSTMLGGSSWSSPLNLPKFDDAVVVDDKKNAQESVFT